MRSHWKYLGYVVRHKWYVLIECWRYGLIWQGLVHDWHKFLPREWQPYVRHFYGTRAGAAPAGGYKKPDDTDDAAFDLAWLWHQKLGRHHWQWWLLPMDDGTTRAMEMPERYWKEMVADWRGAGKAQGFPDTLAWYVRNRDVIRLHPSTREHVERELGYASSDIPPVPLMRGD